MAPEVRYVFDLAPDIKTFFVVVLVLMVFGALTSSKD